MKFIEDKLRELDNSDANPLQIDIAHLYEGQDLETFMNLLKKKVRNQQITYTGVAIEYLYQHDMSLEKSLEIAIKRGFSMKNLDSETLATLLYQQDLKSQLEVVEALHINRIFKEAEELAE